MNFLFGKPDSANSRPVFCYGAGNIGRQFTQFAYLVGIIPSHFIDRNLAGTVIAVKNNPCDYARDVPVISVAEAQKFGVDNPIIITMLYPDAAARQLQGAGFTNIWRLPLQIPIPIINETAFKVAVESNRIKIEYVRRKLYDERSREVLDGMLQYGLGGCTDFALVDSVFDVDEYFPSGIVALAENCCFIDGGCYDNSTAIEFAARTNHGYAHIYSFEPNM